MNALKCSESSKPKRILVLYYSQTGQLADAVRSMMSPLRNHPNIRIDWRDLKPVEPYPYPWSLIKFLNVFPESVLMIPPEMKPVNFDPDSHYDLVVLAYQVWFLSPSLPVTGFLKSQDARILKGKPVITMIVCRNMWLSAQEKMKSLLHSVGATLIDNAVLVDQGPPWATFITTPRWLITGKREGFWSIFPPAGVSQRDISGAARFGKAILDNLDGLETNPGKPLLAGVGAVKVNQSYIGSEKAGHRAFTLWSRLLRMAGKLGELPRRVMLFVFLIYLVFMILTFVPVGMVVRALLKPFMAARLKEQAKRFERPSGSSTEKMEQYI